MPPLAPNSALPKTLLYISALVACVGQLGGGGMWAVGCVVGPQYHLHSACSILCAYDVVGPWCFDGYFERYCAVRWVSSYHAFLHTIHPWYCAAVRWVFCTL